MNIPLVDQSETQTFAQPMYRTSRSPGYQTIFSRPRFLRPVKREGCVLVARYPRLSFASHWRAQEQLRIS